VRLTKSSTLRPEENRAEAGGRQHMVRAADIVADRFGRVAANEDGAGVINLRRQLFAFSQMIRDVRRRCDRRAAAPVQAFRHDDRAVIAPGRRGDLLARQVSMPLDGGDHRSPRPASSVMRIDCADSSCSA